jgi:lipoprotein-releasing system permease protein
VVSPLGSPTAIGVIPKVRRFVVTGILRTGMNEIDSTLVLLSLSDAQKFFEMDNAVSNIEDPDSRRRSIASGGGTHPA